MNNNPNPFLPQGSLLEQKSKKRTRVKVAVFTIFAINIAVLSPLLIQGCKKDQTASQTDTGMTATNPVVAENPSNSLPVLPVPDTNPPPQVTAQPTNPPPVVVPPTAVTPTPPNGTPSEYVVTKGDSYYTIGKKLGVSIKDLKAANPGVVPTKLKVGQKLQVPAGGTSAGNPSAGSGSMTAAPSGETTEAVYVVRSRDTLTKIAREHGVSLKALRAANALKTDSIKVGQKLKLPAKSAMSSAPVAPDTANPPVTNPVPTGAPGTAH